MDRLQRPVGQRCVHPGGIAEQMRVRDELGGSCEFTGLVGSLVYESEKMHTLPEFARAADIGSRVVRAGNDYSLPAPTKRPFYRF